MTYDDPIPWEPAHYYWVDGRGANSTWLNGAHLFHALGLTPGERTIRMVLTGDRNEKSSGSKMWVERAIVFESEQGGRFPGLPRGW